MSLSKSFRARTTDRGNVLVGVFRFQSFDLLALNMPVGDIAYLPLSGYALAATQIKTLLEGL